MKVLKLIALAFSTVLLAACMKPVEYPIEPKIAYEGFTYIFNADSTFSGEGILAFSYTDGDGDLGLNDDDTMSPFGPNDPYYYNMVVDYLKCVNGVFVKTPLLSWNQHRLRDNDDPKAISGTMEYTMPVQNPLSPDDTIKFEIHIIDRALHESNVIQTEAIFTNPVIFGSKSDINLK